MWTYLEELVSKLDTILKSIPSLDHLLDNHRRPELQTHIWIKLPIVWLSIHCMTLSILLHVQCTCVHHPMMWGQRLTVCTLHIVPSAGMTSVNSSSDSSFVVSVSEVRLCWLTVSPYCWLSNFWSYRYSSDRTTRYYLHDYIKLPPSLPFSFSPSPGDICSQDAHSRLVSLAAPSVRPTQEVMSPLHHMPVTSLLHHILVLSSSLIYIVATCTLYMFCSKELCYKCVYFHPLLKPISLLLHILQLFLKLNINQNTKLIICTDVCTT